MYELFDHTADLGLRVRAADLDTLFAEAAAALFSAVVDDPRTIRPSVPVEIRVAGDEPDYLLFDWLQALLLQVELEQMLFAKFEVRVGPDGLTATIWGEPIDRQRHPLSHEVKAITYHGLRVERDGDGWLAEVIVDI